MITKFDPVGMTEDRFWELVDMAHWPKTSCEDAKIMYRKLLSKEGAKNFRGSVGKAYRMLDRVADQNVHGVGDDGYSDLLKHIVGKGKSTFYKCLNSVNLIQKMADDNDYKESFSYCIPYESDYDPNGEYSIQAVINVAKMSQQEIEKFLDMEYKTRGNWLEPILPIFLEIHTLFYHFLEDPTPDNLTCLVGKKGWMEKVCKKIENFFQKNYMELPRKFTENGNNGVCTPLFSNTCHDAEKVMKFLKD